jgi:hypothetical protein
MRDYNSGAFTLPSPENQSRHRPTSYNGSDTWLGVGYE